MKRLEWAICAVIVALILFLVAPVVVAAPKTAEVPVAVSPVDTPIVAPSGWVRNPEVVAVQIRQRAPMDLQDWLKANLTAEQRASFEAWLFRQLTPEQDLERLVNWRYLQQLDGTQTPELDVRIEALKKTVAAGQRASGAK